MDDKFGWEWEWRVGQQKKDQTGIFWDRGGAWKKQTLAKEEGLNYGSNSSETGR